MSEDTTSAPQFFFVSPKGRIHYRQFTGSGGGRCVCLLPGFTMPSALYAPIARALCARGHSVVAIDYWGRGHSDRPSDGDFSLESHACEVLMLLQHLRIDRCCLIGFSYGAAVAAAAAQRMEAAVDCLAFVSPLLAQREEPSPLQQFVLGARLIGPLVLRLTAAASVPRQVEQQFCFPSRCEGTVRDACAACLRQYESGWAGCAAVSRAIADYDAREVREAAEGLRGIGKRMMVLFGEQDSLVDVRSARAWWGKRVPRAEISVIEDGGHLLFLENTEETLRLLLRFLDE